MTTDPGVPERPHRGVLILLLAAAGPILVLTPLLLLPIDPPVDRARLALIGLAAVCTPLGLIANWIATRDLAAMERGEMDVAGAELTRVGRVCARVSIVLVNVALLLWKATR